MTNRVTLIRRDKGTGLSAGFSVVLLTENVTDTETLSILLKDMLKEDVDLHISPTKLIVEYHWQ